MSKSDLTNKNFWDEYWENSPLPSEIKRSNKELFLNILLDAFDKFLPKEKDKTVIEIGGSPGRYLAYMYKNFGYKIHSLDYSETGYKKTVENFKLLNIPIEVYNMDLFSDDLNLPQFDIVYSLGFIEHFYDLDLVIEKHLHLLKPGGILLIGVPNYQGINKWFLKNLAPQLLSIHNLAAMNSENWRSFEKKFNLKKIFKGYIGGFEPQNLNRWEKKNLKTFILKSSAKMLSLLLHNNFKILRKFNSKFFSAYLLAVYKKPEENNSV